MKEILNNIYSKSCNSYYRFLKKMLKDNNKKFIITANPEIIMHAEKNDEINNMLNDKDVSIVPDGIAVVKAARMVGNNVQERITGVDIAEKLFEYCNELNKSLYLFGAKSEVIDCLTGVIKTKYPNVKLLGATNGYVADKDAVMEKIVKLKPDVVMVALGVPAQEKLIYKYYDKFKKGIFIGVGGSFDVLSGIKKRAPKIFIKTNTEWLYRIICEPKRLKRFWNNNIKFIFKVKKNKNRINTCFLIVFSAILLGGLLNPILNPDEINYYENRTAYQIPKLKLYKIFDKSFQDEMELSFSDQIPLAIYMKKGYNVISNFVTKILDNTFFSNDCDNRYININNSTTTFGCDGNLVYHISYVSYSKDDYDSRIENINDVIKKSPVDVYIYYIEKDTDINFSSNTKSDIYNYLKENINTDKINKFEINSFEEFTDYFYKTDHHWNYKGSYKGYTDIAKFLGFDDILKHQDEICLNDNFSGSKANFAGATHLYKERFCVYTFDFPNYKIYVNGKVGKYGNEQYHINHPNKDVSYGKYYGSDDGEVIFDNNDGSKENILILGESYDNAILKMLASNFNKTFSVDLRNYERENDKNFNYFQYIDDNKIDRVLLIGNRDYYKAKEFNLEV